MTTFEQPIYRVLRKRWPKELIIRKFPHNQQKRKERKQLTRVKTYKGDRARV